MTLLVLSGCGGLWQAATLQPNDLADALRFRAEVGLRADEAWAVAVARNPLSSTKEFGIPLLPNEIAELEARARHARAVGPIVEAYGARHPDTFAGAFIDNEGGGGVVALFTGGIADHEANLRAMVHPSAILVIRDARFTLRDLENLQDRLQAERDWFLTIGAHLGSTGVDIPANVVRAGVARANPQDFDRITAHFGAAGMIALYEEDERSLLPRGGLRGQVIDRAGRPLAIADLEVQAIGDIGAYEPDGGVAYVTRPDGTFEIPRLATMGWEVRIIQRTDTELRVIGKTRVNVVPGLTTFVEVVIQPLGTSEGSRRLVVA